MLYQDTERVFARLDRRNTRYRFDLEVDMPWDRIGEPGLHLGPRFLESVGIDAAGLAAHPEAHALFQWATGLEIAQAFSALEGYLLDFVDDESAALEDTRSIWMLYEEERKHIALFDRYAEALRALHPEWVADFDRCFEAYRPAFLNPYNRGAYPDAVVQHYFFWLKTVFFEEYTIYLQDRLEAERPLIQPAWLAAHRLHGQEELQHVVTDAAYLESLAIDPVVRRGCATAFWQNFEATFDLFLGVAASRDLVRERFPEVGRLVPTVPAREMAIFADVGRHRTFRRTRRAAPGLGRLETRPDPTLSRLAGPPLKVPEGTLVDALDHAVAQHPDHGVTLVRPTGGEHAQTYAELRTAALGVLDALRHHGAGRGTHVLLAVTDAEPFLPAFWACLLGGMVPVPLGGSFSKSSRDDAMQKAARVLEVLGANTRVVLPRPQLRQLVSLIGSGLPLVSYEGLLEHVPEGEVAPSPGGPDDLGLVQFSSGSTGHPKGVRLTHRNLLANIAAILSDQHGGAEDSFVSWLPLFHDMGLIGYHLLPVVAGARQTLMHPMHFVRRPMDWLEALHRHRATVTASPNFGLAHTLSRVDPARLPALDLSPIHCILNGAEPISARVMDRFVDALAPTGLRAEAMTPAYGLAEGTLCLTAKPKHTRARVQHLARRQLDQGRRVQVLREGDPEAVPFVSVGTPIDGVVVRVVDDGGQTVPQGTIGHVEARGPNVTSGYHGNPEATAEVFRDGWLRTGDLGVVVDHELVITGRSKDVLFVNGRNVYAHDLEDVIARVPGVVPGRACAFGVPEDETGRDLVCAAFAVEDDAEVDEVVQNVQAEIGEVFGFALDYAAVVDPRQIPRTSSGKLQRSRMRARFQKGAVQPWVPHADDEATEVADGRMGLFVLVRACWAEALGIEATTIKGDTSFTSLGGGSLKAAHVHALLEDRLGKVLAYELLMEAGTVDETVDWLMQAHPTLAKRGQPRNIAELARDYDALEEGREAEAPEPEPYGLPEPDPFQEPEPAAVRAPAAPVVVAANREEPTPAVVSEVAVRSGDVAIVGLGLKLPGASSPDAFWEMLEAGRDAFSAVPPDRWDHAEVARLQSAQGLPTCPTGAFLDDLFSFDPAPFGLDPALAAALNPQHRLFLEVAAQAMADAGTGRGRVGVFVSQGEPPANFRTWLDDIARRGVDVTGQLQNSTNNMIAAHLSRTFDLTGPAMVVQAACASSLVAVHQARRALQHGECDVAVAGGVELLHTPTMYLLFGPSGVLSARGACRPFTAAADGFVPGEGAAALVLKPLDRAMADGDRIYAVIRGSAVGNDGRQFSQMAPNPEGQRDVIRRALAEAGVDPLTVGMVETHGTATPVGDAVEARALMDLYGGETDLPCALTSVKSNLGHLIAAAGAAALVKTSLALSRGRVPPIAGFDTVGPRLPFAGRVAPAATEGAFPAAPGEPRRAAVNSLGIGGTNCHLVLEAGPVVPAPEGPVVVALSAHDGEALRALARDTAARARAGDGLALAASLSRAANLHRHRAASVCEDAGGALAALDAMATGEHPAHAGRPSLVLVFPGPGSQWTGMAEALLDDPVFSDALDACDAIAAPLLGRSLWPLLDGSDDSGVIDEIDVSQPAVFAMSYATVAWLRSVGIAPDAVLGHSAGEYAALCAAGVLSLRDALTVLIARGKAMAATEGGAMAAVFSDEATLAPHLDAVDGVSVAAFNAPGQLVVSGPSDAVDALVAQLGGAGIPSKRLAISCAAHSPLMEPAATTLRSALREVGFQPPAVPVVSTRTGREQPLFEAHDLTRQLVGPVRFQQAVERALELGHRLFVEVGGSAVLSPVIEAIARDRGVGVTTASVHRRTTGGRTVPLQALATLFEAGRDLRFGRLGATGAAYPDYPWHRVSMPVPLAMEQVARAPGGAAGERAVPLGPSDRALFAAHEAGGMAIAPAAWMLDKLLAGSGLPAGLEKVLIRRPLAASASKWRVAADEAGLRIEADDGDGVWEACLEARGAEVRGADPGLPLCPSNAVELDPAEIYAVLEKSGLRYGPAFRTLRRVRRAGDALWIDLAPVGAPSGAVLDPTVLDGAFQAMAAYALEVGGKGSPFLGFAIGRVDLSAPLVGTCQGYIRLRSEIGPASESIRCDIALASGGEVALRLTDFSAKRRADLGPRAFVPGWEAVEVLRAAPPSGRVAVFIPPASGMAEALVQDLIDGGAVALGPHAPDDAHSLAGKSALAQADAVVAAPTTLEQAIALLAPAKARRVLLISPSRAVAALARSLGAERPEVALRVLVPAAALATDDLWAAMAAPTDRAVLRRTDEGWERPVLVAATLPEADGAPVREGGVYWVAGGTSGIGAAVAEALAERAGGGTLVLSSRRADLDPALRERLEALGATVEHRPVDLSDPTAIGVAAGAIRKAHGALHGVVHSAGALEVAPLTDRSTAGLAAVLGPKVIGGPALVEAAEGADWVVLVSSLAAHVPSPGQADYAAAAGALCDLAHGSHPVRVVAVDFGPWGETGMVAAEGFRAASRRVGLPPMSTVDGVGGFLRAIAGDLPEVVVTRLDSPRRVETLRGAPAWGNALPEAALPARPAPAPAPRAAPAPAPAPKAPAPKAAPTGSLDQDLRAILAGLLRRSPDDLDLHLGFAELGVDSLMATQVVQALEERLGTTLHPTLLFEHPTPQALLAHLREIAPQAPPRAPASPAPPAEAPLLAEGDVEAWVVERGPAGARLLLGGVAVAAPGPGEVTIAADAWGVNFIDVLASTGLHPMIHAARFVPGHEVAGTVVAAGAGVKGLKPGDAVMALVHQGGFARRVTVPARLAHPRPAALDAEGAAGLLITGLTAVACIEEAGRVGPGDRVLVQAAAGATGTACVQLALHHGATVLGTASSVEKLARLRLLGVHHPIRYTVEAFEDAVRARTGEVDVIIDALSGDAIGRGLSVLAEGGRFVEIGLGEAVEVEGLDPRQLFLRSQSFLGVNLGALMRDEARLGRLLARLLELVEAGGLEPAIGHRVPFAQADAALDLIRSRGSIGKVVLVP